MCGLFFGKIDSESRVGKSFSLLNFMENKLFVGNIPYSSSEESLSEAFSEAGTVDSAKIIMDKNTGRSRGFGFVEMSSQKEAEKAIEMFNGKEFEGRTLVVNEARPMNNERE